MIHFATQILVADFTNRRSLLDRKTSFPLRIPASFTTEIFGQEKSFAEFKEFLQKPKG
jgi:hypothetical protein